LLQYNIYHIFCDICNYYIWYYIILLAKNKKTRLIREIENWKEIIKNITYFNTFSMLYDGVTVISVTVYHKIKYLLVCNI